MHYEFDDLPIRLTADGPVMFEVSGCCGIETSIIYGKRDIESWSAFGISLGYSGALTHLESDVRYNNEAGRQLALLVEQALERESAADIIEKLAAHYGIRDECPRAEHGHLQRELV